MLVINPSNAGYSAKRKLAHMQYSGNPKSRSWELIHYWITVSAVMKEALRSWNRGPLLRVRVVTAVSLAATILSFIRTLLPLLKTPWMLPYIKHFDQFY